LPRKNGKQKIKNQNAHTPPAQQPRYSGQPPGRHTVSTGTEHRDNFIQTRTDLYQKRNRYIAGDLRGAAGAARRQSVGHGARRGNNT